MENTGSALAEDVIQKSEIIKSYFMANKAGEMSIVLVWHYCLCEVNLSVDYWSAVASLMASLICN